MEHQHIIRVFILVIHVSEISESLITFVIHETDFLIIDDH